MAVYERAWRRFSGILTQRRWRFLVISRYGLQNVFESRAFLLLYILSALPAVIGLFLVYLAHNASLLEAIGADSKLMQGLTVAFFRRLFVFQAVPAFFITVVVSPGLIAPDLADNCLPLYLSRPIRKRDYVLGKMAVLFVLLSPLTWLASLLVIGLHAQLEGPSGWAQAGKIGLAHLIGHLTWILVISLLSLAVSAWVRHKPVASGALLACLLAPRAMAAIINHNLSTHWGLIIDPLNAITSLVQRMFGLPELADLPAWASCATLAAVCLLSLRLLATKLEAHEVIT